MRRGCFICLNRSGGEVTYSYWQPMPAAGWIWGFWLCMPAPVGRLHSGCMYATMATLCGSRSGDLLLV